MESLLRIETMGKTVGHSTADSVLQSMTLQAGVDTGLFGAKIRGDMAEG